MGATGGGVWKTTDDGNTWNNISDEYFNTTRIRVSSRKNFIFSLLIQTSPLTTEAEPLRILLIKTKEVSEYNQLLKAAGLPELYWP